MRAAPAGLRRAGAPVAGTVARAYCTVQVSTVMAPLLEAPSLANFSPIPGAGRGAWRGGGRTAPALCACIVGWATSARGHRTGHCGRALAADSRRADLGARCVGPGRDPQATGRPQGPVGDELPVRVA